MFDLVKPGAHDTLTVALLFGKNYICKGYIQKEYEQVDQCGGRGGDHIYMYI
jgi:hypothetical protein